MAAFGFLRKILASEEIEIFNNGNMKRILHILMMSLSLC